MGAAPGVPTESSRAHQALPGQVRYRAQARRTLPAKRVRLGWGRESDYRGRLSVIRTASSTAASSSASRDSIRERPPDSKSGEPRLVAMGGDLYDTLRSGRRQTERQNPKCLWVCQYRGRHCQSIRTTWMTACVRVGLGRWRKPDEPDIGKRGFIGPRCHDFRRTAVRNLIRARVPEKLAMQISGHKARSVFER